MPCRREHRRKSSPAGKGSIANAPPLYLPEGLDVSLNGLEILDCYIGNGGFTGKIATNWSGDPEPPGGNLFGIDLTLESLTLELRQSIPVAAEIVATVEVPFSTSLSR